MIPPVKPGGWGPEFVPSAPELAQLDQLVGDRGLDSFGGDFVTGTLSLFQDPLHAGTPPKITGTVSVTEHSVMGTGPAGSLACAGTVPTYSASRTRVVRYSPLTWSGSAATRCAGTCPVWRWVQVMTAPSAPRDRDTSAPNRTSLGPVRKRSTMLAAMTAIRRTLATAP